MRDGQELNLLSHWALELQPRILDRYFLRNISNQLFQLAASSALFLVVDQGFEPRMPEATVLQTAEVANASRQP